MEAKKATVVHPEMVEMACTGKPYKLQVQMRPDGKPFMIHLQAYEFIVYSSKGGIVIYKFDRKAQTANLVRIYNDTKA